MFYFVKAMVSELDVKIIERSSELPPLQCNDFFHSSEMFCIVEKTSGMQPFMVIAIKKGQVVAHMLATLRRRGALIPPYIFTQGHVYGEGEYASEENKEEIFEKMLEAITQRLKKKLCFYIEFSFLSQKMFGYRVFRKNNYCPVHWMEIHNSLHSKEPEERLSKKMKERIEAIKEANLCFQEVEDDKQFHAFYKMLRRFFSLKIRRYMPPAPLFYELNKSNHARPAPVFITRTMRICGILHPNVKVIPNCTLPQQLYGEPSNMLTKMDADTFSSWILDCRTARIPTVNLFSDSEGRKSALTDGSVSPFSGLTGL